MEKEIVELVAEQKTKGIELFGDWEETAIWSCKQNVMGRLYADSVENPTAVMVILGDFTFFAGTPKKEIVLYRPEWLQQDFMIMVPQNEAWAQLIEECYKENARKVSRYAIKKEADVFNKEKLEAYVANLPSEYTMEIVDERLFDQSKVLEWAMDLTSQYSEYQLYKEKGLGVMVLKDDVPVAGASSYSSYQGGIEIEIDTSMEYRRQGLATCCGAKLILECLNRGWYPSWDAQNKWSVALSEKLGYHFDHEYTAYEVVR